VIHSEVVEVISSADAGICLIENVSLSDFMSLPNKVFEYAFAGLPIIASNFPELSNVVLGYKLGKVIEPSPELLLGAVLETERNSKFNSGPPNSLLPLSWEEQERKLIDIYRRLTTDQ
jgi:glycosyltransferase involved in cell wall biosynthesis